MDDLLRLLDDARAQERRAARRAERDLTRMAEEGASLVGTLVDLCEARVPALVRTVTGRAHHGPVRLVGRDFCAIASPGGDVWLRLDAVGSVTPSEEVPRVAATGDRGALDLLLVDALARVLPERPRLAFVTAGETVAGELRAVGEDVATLWLDGDGRRTCYVSLRAVLEVLRSG